MATWTEEYLEQAIADEIELAKAGGYSKVTVPPMPTRTTALLAQSRDRLKVGTPLPRWRRDWNAAGDLIEEFNLSIRQDDEDGTVSVGIRGRRLDVTEKYADHPDKAGAILAAIVGISIQLRAEQRDNQAERRRSYRR
ncbi:MULTISPECIES: hypothetical protein [unclassified Massilia]|uniref:hypothetical protein n=1 Tax=unclassified Massilia TaxID=2609279 RepID=UPI00177C19C7|nr:MULTISPECIES: hypothetical protein [unclassified Massilia]MBD8531519.1 hypothetical protein [Massilia sp. CFBP 13647]MBD8673685.1 hypothetical protein [Massilia sp. CFBP 13721]